MGKLTLRFVVAHLKGENVKSNIAVKLLGLEL